MIGPKTELRLFSFLLLFVISTAATAVQQAPLSEQDLTPRAAEPPNIEDLKGQTIAQLKTEILASVNTSAEARAGEGFEWNSINNLLNERKSFICSAAKPIFDKFVGFDELVLALGAKLPTIPGIPKLLVQASYYLAAYLVRAGVPAWCEWELT